MYRRKKKFSHYVDCRLSRETLKIKQHDYILSTTVAIPVDSNIISDGLSIAAYVLTRFPHANILHVSNYLFVPIK